LEEIDRDLPEADLGTRPSESALDVTSGLPVIRQQPGEAALVSIALDALGSPKDSQIAYRYAPHEHT
jgi:hypothetical protein